jgi:hypothetical protein
MKYVNPLHKYTLTPFFKIRSLTAVTEKLQKGILVS